MHRPSTSRRTRGARPTARMPGVRRALVSLLLFVLLSAGSGAILGLAAAEGESPESPADGASAAGTFQMASPRVEDRGRYAITDDVTRDGQFDFEWRQDRRIALPDGTPLDAQVIAFNDSRDPFDDDWPTVHSLLLHPDRFIVVGELTEWAEQDLDERPGPLGTAGTETEERDRWSIYLREDYTHRLPCSLSTFLHGRTLAVGQVLTDISGCERQMDHLGLFPENAPEEPSRYWIKVADIQVRDGVKIMAVEHWGNRESFRVNGERVDAIYGRSWYEEGNPYPIRTERIFNPHRGIDDDNTVYELTHLERGDDEPIGAGQELAPLPGGPLSVDVVPRTPWMFDDSGIDHPFKVSEAYQYAHDDPTSGLASFLEAHPDAYIARAGYWQYERQEAFGTTYDYEWRLTFTDGIDVHYVDIGKRSPVADFTGIEAVPPTYYYFEPSHGQDEYPPPSWLPDEVPTVASMWAIWERHASEDFRSWGANSWAWGISCCGRDEPRFKIGVGRFEDASSTPTPLDNQSYRREWSHLEWEFQEADLPFRYTETVSESHWEPEGEPIPEHQGSDPAAPGGKVPRFQPLAAIGLLVLDEPEQAAAVGIGALLVALAYYFFPAIKSGVAAPLFSRVEARTALDHPVRQRIFDVVHQKPGIHREALVRDAGIASGQVAHHMEKLVHTGILQQKKQNGYTCYFVKGAVDRHFMAAASAVRAPTARAILEVLARQGAVPSIRLAELSNVSASTATYHVKKLKAAGLAESGPGGPRITALGRRILDAA